MNEVANMADSLDFSYSCRSCCPVRGVDWPLTFTNQRQLFMESSSLTLTPSRSPFLQAESIAVKTYLINFLFCILKMLSTGYDGTHGCHQHQVRPLNKQSETVQNLILGKYHIKVQQLKMKCCKKIQIKIGMINSKVECLKMPATQTVVMTAQEAVKVARKFPQVVESSGAKLLLKLCIQQRVEYE